MATPKKDPHAKIVARRKLRNALKTGALARLPCEVCGEPAQAHHDDYSHPLAVRWLCARHHMAVHRDAIPSNRGQTNGQAKITESIAREIRARYLVGRGAKWARGKISQRQLAREYGISPAQVFKIGRGERWAWIDERTSTQ